MQAPKSAEFVNSSDEEDTSENEAYIRKPGFSMI
jgi:hypothetical protein